MTDAHAVHPFDAAMSMTLVDPGRYVTTTHPAYMNMVGPFGGVTAAQMLSSVLENPECMGTPISISVNFLAPIADGTIAIKVRKTRQNRSSQHWYVEMFQGDENLMLTNATVMTGIRRPSWRAVEIQPPSTLSQAPSSFESLETKMPWVDRYEFSFLEGRPVVDPGESSFSSSRTVVWVRDALGRPCDFPGLLATTDTFFPRIQLRRPDWVPVGTVSMTAYFHCDQGELDKIGSEALLGVARGQVFGLNYFDQTSQVWTRDGRCLATASQVVYFKG